VTVLVRIDSMSKAFDWATGDLVVSTLGVPPSAVPPAAWGLALLPPPMDEPEEMAYPPLPSVTAVPVAEAESAEYESGDASSRKAAPRPTEAPVEDEATMLSSRPPTAAPYEDDEADADAASSWSRYNPREFPGAKADAEADPTASPPVPNPEPAGPASDSPKPEPVSDLERPRTPPALDTVPGGHGGWPGPDAPAPSAHAAAGRRSIRLHVVTWNCAGEGVWGWGGGGAAAESQWGSRHVVRRCGRPPARLPKHCGFLSPRCRVFFGGGTRRRAHAVDVVATVPPTPFTSPAAPAAPPARWRMGGLGRRGQRGRRRGRLDVSVVP